MRGSRFGGGGSRWRTFRELTRMISLHVASPPPVKSESHLLATSTPKPSAATFKPLPSPPSTPLNLLESPLSIFPPMATVRSPVDQTRPFKSSIYLLKRPWLRSRATPRPSPRSLGWMTTPWFPPRLIRPSSSGRMTPGNGRSLTTLLAPRERSLGSPFTHLANSWLPLPPTRLGLSTISLRVRRSRRTLRSLVSRVISPTRLSLVTQMVFFMRAVPRLDPSECGMSVIPLPSLVLSMDTRVNPSTRCRSPRTDTTSLHRPPQLRP